MDLTTAEIPQPLIRQLELDAGHVEAVWLLDQPVGSLNLHAMLRDTLAALEQLPQACAGFRKHLPSRAHPLQNPGGGTPPQSGRSLLDAPRS
jgi:hypothetical protein